MTNFGKTRETKLQGRRRTTEGEAFEGDEGTPRAEACPILFSGDLEQRE